MSLFQSIRQQSISRYLIQQKHKLWVGGVLLVTYFYLWDTLLASLDGSHYKSILIVCCVVVMGVVDVNDMVGQPESDDDHHNN